MADRSTPRVTDATLEGAAAVLAYLVAVVHLFHPSHGFARLALILSVDPTLLGADPRPLAFVLASVAILVAVPAVIRGVVSKRLVIALGVLLTTTFVAGYFAWHLSGHGGFLPGREPLYHGVTPIEAVVAHLTTDPWAAVSILTELPLLGVLLVLLYRHEV